VISEKTVTVSLPAELCASVLERYASRFANIDDLLTFLLQELLRDDAMKMDQREKQILEARLKDLGYL
jgi:hypothetical protein